MLLEDFNAGSRVEALSQIRSALDIFYMENHGNRSKLESIFAEPSLDIILTTSPNALQLMKALNGMWAMSTQCLSAAMAGKQLSSCHNCRYGRQCECLSPCHLHTARFVLTALQRVTRRHNEAKTKALSIVKMVMPDHGDDDSVEPQQRQYNHKSNTADDDNAAMNVSMAAVDGVADDVGAVDDGTKADLIHKHKHGERDHADDEKGGVVTMESDDKAADDERLVKDVTTITENKEPQMMSIWRHSAPSVDDAETMLERKAPETAVPTINADTSSSSATTIIQGQIQEMFHILVMMIVFRVWKLLVVSMSTNVTSYRLKVPPILITKTIQAVF